MQYDINIKNIDIQFLEKFTHIVFGLIFAAPPDVDCGDPLEGESLRLIAGKEFFEILPLLNDELDQLPFFSVCTPEVAKYYLGGYMLYFLKMVEASRRIYPFSLNSIVLGPDFLSMLIFLERVEILDWIRSMDELSNLVSNFLIMIVNTAGFDLEDQTEESIMRICKYLK